MAGGKGTRLRPYTATFPKPLVPVGDRPILEILLRQLAAAGIDHAVIAVNHLRHIIEAFFGDGRRFGLGVSYVTEDRPLGTAGPIGNAIDRLGEHFVVANGDLLTTLDFRAMIKAHRTSGAAATVGSFPREERSDFGILEVDDAMRMVGYREKPTHTHLVSMGLYVLSREAVRPHVAPDTPLDMPDLLRALVSSGREVRCHRADGLWLDIGRPEDYAAAQKLREENPALFDERPADRPVARDGDVRPTVT